MAVLHTRGARLSGDHCHDHDHGDRCHDRDHAGDARSSIVSAHRDSISDNHGAGHDDFLPPIADSKPTHGYPMHDSRCSKGRTLDSSDVRRNP